MMKNLYDVYKQFLKEGYTNKLMKELGLVLTPDSDSILKIINASQKKIIILETSENLVDSALRREYKVYSLAVLSLKESLIMSRGRENGEWTAVA